MKIVELLKISSPALKMLSDNEVPSGDWRFVAMYEAFQNMRACGVKYREAVRELAADYQVSRATIERAIKRLSLEC
jgi:alpha-ketoglutarate-dependent taurine dioxygenase